MTAKNALGIVLLWGVTFAVVGGLIGATLGLVAPEYYRSVLRDGHSPNFNPLQVGIGLGVTQGLASGVAIALGVIALLVWRETRSTPSDSNDPTANAERPMRSWWRLAFWGAATSLAIGVSCTVTFTLGAIVGQGQLYQAWTDRKLQTVAKILETNEFPQVQSDYSSAAQVYLTGEVQDEATRRTLRDKLVLAFGTEEAEQMLLGVKIGKQ